MVFRLYQDRSEAECELAKRLSAYVGKQDVLVLALLRGGVSVAEAVAKSLALTMDVCLVRKLGVPGHEELAMGAISVAGNAMLITISWQASIFPIILSRNLFS